MIVIGDVHGKFKEYEFLCRRFTESTLQLGDMGVGFPGGGQPHAQHKDKWFRGNHDSPAVARVHPQYLGEGGMAEIEKHKFFYVPGAFSVDHELRRPGISWWADEELRYPALAKLITEYEANKPDLVFSHQAPDSVALAMFKEGKTYSQKLIPTRTGMALQTMLDVHKPKLWVFGHYHEDWKKNINGSEFICLPELGWMRI